MTVNIIGKIETLYINVESTRLLQISKKYYYEYKNKICKNNLQINIRYCDAESSYSFNYPMVGSKISKGDFILNCCSEFAGRKTPDLESSKRIDRFTLIQIIK